MKNKIHFSFNQKLLFISLALFLGGCMRSNMRPINSLNEAIFLFSSSYREPSLGTNWLATLSNADGKDKIEMIDIRSRRRILLPGLNRADSQPISVSVSANGKRLAIVRQREDKTELLLYRRNLGTVQRIELNPKGIPRRVSLDALGKVLAVQVSRGGKWDVEVIRLKD